MYKDINSCSLLAVQSIKITATSFAKITSRHRAVKKLRKAYALHCSNRKKNTWKTATKKSALRL
jgi:hypothetical protein